MVTAALALATASLVAAFGDRASQMNAHPLHTTLTEITVDPVHRTIQAVVRVFDDDLARAVRRRDGAGARGVSDAQAGGYVTSALGVSQSGVALLLRPCGVRRSGDLLWVCVQGSTVAKGSLEMRNAMLCDVFSDQVNIVQINANGTKKSVLFTRGDTPKPLL